MKSLKEACEDALLGSAKAQNEKEKEGQKFTKKKKENKKDTKSEEE